MSFNEKQLDSLSRYFSDISKVLVASTVVGFFVPIGGGAVTLPAFAVGSVAATLSLLASVRLIK